MATAVVLSKLDNHIQFSIYQMYSIVVHSSEGRFHTITSVLITRSPSSTDSTHSKRTALNYRWTPNGKRHTKSTPGDKTRPETVLGGTIQFAKHRE